MGLYEELREIDVLAPISAQLRAGVFKLRLIDEEIRIIGTTSIKIDKPWIDAKYCSERKCDLWLTTYFKYYRIIPKGCRNCWKIVFHPKNLKEAFEVLDLQVKQGFPSKTGMEERPHSGNQGGWSSFWYAPLEGGLAGGRKLHKIVRRDLKQKFGRGAVLKRGCTEMEHHTIQAGLGNSEDWNKGAEFYDKKEALLDAVWRLERMKVVEPPRVLITFTKIRWIERALEHGDSSYLDYCDGPLLEALMSYQNSLHSERDFVSTWDRPENGHNEGEEVGDDRNRRTGSGKVTKEEFTKLARTGSKAKLSIAGKGLDVGGPSGERSDGGKVSSEF